MKVKLKNHDITRRKIEIGDLKLAGFEDCLSLLNFP